MENRETKQSRVQKDEEEEAASECAADLSNNEIRRYSRHLLLREFGCRSHIRVKSSRVLIVGLGGLGTPAALYLAGAGVGTLGLAERRSDKVEESNLHRQIAYTSENIGVVKTTALCEALQQRNAQVKVVVHNEDGGLTPTNAVRLCAAYDVVLDCTDNVKARYVVGDACAVAKTPLVSGAAIGLNGQLSVHSVFSVSPCYRCIFPSPPPPHCVGSCDAAGVLGPVPGVIGTMQAIEALKLVSHFQGAVPLDQKLLLYDAATVEFRKVRLPSRKRDCVACGTGVSFDITAFDYDRFVSGEDATSPGHSIVNAMNDLADLRISVQEFARLRDSGTAVKLTDSIDHREYRQVYSLIDVRSVTEFSICHLQEALNIPLASLDMQSVTAQINEFARHRKTILICRRGNASKHALLALRSAGAQNVHDVVGGLDQWHQDIDNGFPMY